MEEAVKVTLGLKPDIKCPKCSTQPKLETGFFGSFLGAMILNRFEKEGGTVTCPKCKTKYTVKGTDNANT
jgi:uncharacterized Zn-finger protein